MGRVGPVGLESISACLVKAAGKEDHQHPVATIYLDVFALIDDCPSSLLFEIGVESRLQAKENRSCLCVKALRESLSEPSLHVYKS